MARPRAGRYDAPVIALLRLLLALATVHLLACLAFAAITGAFLMLLRGQPLRLDRRLVAWLTREWLGTAALIAIRPLGLLDLPPRPGAHPSTQGGDAIPVLLVPGYTMTRSCFTFLALYLRRRGWRWVWGVNNRPHSQPVPVFAHHLAQQVEALCRASASEQVDIVAHSMGGLVTAWYVQHLGGARRVRQVVTLGTPWAGSMVAVFGMRPEARDLMPGSEVQRSLAPPAVPWTSIWSPHDNVVLPPESAVVPGARHVELPWIGHNSLLVSARAFREVATVLRRDPSQGDRAAGPPLSAP